MHKTLPSATLRLRDSSGHGWTQGPLTFIFRGDLRSHWKYLGKRGLKERNITESPAAFYLDFINSGYPRRKMKQAPKSLYPSLSSDLFLW